MARLVGVENLRILMATALNWYASMVCLLGWAKDYLCQKLSTTQLGQWGFRQWLPFSWTTPRVKHCRHPIAVMGAVDTLRL